MPILGAANIVPTSAGVVSVKDFGAKGDSISRADAATTNGSAVVTSASGSFTTADVGKQFRVYNGGTTHATTIASVQSATQVTLAANVPFTGAARYYSYGTSDTAAITSAIAALGTAAANYSKTLYFPASSGWYWDTTQRNFDLSDNVTILGEGRKVWPRTSYHAPAYPSEWRYVADDATTFISARGSFGFTTRGMAVRGEGQNYSGTLLDLSGNATLFTFSATLDTCHFADARSNQGTATGVELKGAVCVSVRHCSWENLGQQVQCVNGTGNFANVITFTDCIWAGAQGSGGTGRAVNVPYAGSVVATQWAFIGCTFEPTTLGQAPVLIDQCLSVRFDACGFWDSSPGPTGAVTQASASGTLRGLSFAGCHWEVATSGFAFALKTVAGLSVIGNDFAQAAGSGSVFKAGMTATNFQYQGNAHQTTTDNSGVTGGSLTT